jgi:hypothetical protein
MSAVDAQRVISLPGALDVRPVSLDPVYLPVYALRTTMRIDAFSVLAAALGKDSPAVDSESLRGHVGNDSNGSKLNHAR